MMFTTVQKDELSIAMPKRPMTGAVADKIVAQLMYTNLVSIGLRM